MPQTYNDIPASQSLTASRQIILDRDEALRSSFSGTSTPANPVRGQFFFNETTGELSQCTQVTPTVVWTRIPLGVPVPVTQGGTGGATAAAARANLGLGDLALQNAGNLSQDVNQTSTGFLKVAAGTDAQRPGSPVNGMIRYSTTAAAFEGFINGQWQPIGAGSLNLAVQRFNGAGVGTPQNLTLAAAPASINAVDVYIGGVYQQKNTLALAGVTLTLNNGAPVGTNNVEVVVGTGLAIGVAADGSVTPAKLALNGEADVAAGATVDIGLAGTIAKRITGTGQSISSFGTSFTQGPIFFRFVGANTLVNSASLVLPTGANIATAAGDFGIAVPLPAAGGWRVMYWRADGSALTGAQIADQATAEAGTNNTQVMSPLRTAQAIRAQKITQGTAQPTTSGTQVDFTGIPSWARRVTVMFNGVSTSGTSGLLLQIGDSGGIENTGYNSNSNLLETGVTISNSAAGFVIRTIVAAHVAHGAITLSRFDGGNTWVASGVLALTGANGTVTVAGSKQLSDILDRVRVATGNGTDTFDAGSINVTWE